MCRCLNNVTHITCALPCSHVCLLLLHIRSQMCLIPLIMFKAEALVDLPFPPPPKPTNEVVWNIEVLCRFMVNNGPDFENLARKKEARNPQFAFLFGGEPGSDAAIAHEYFQWMKRKCLSEEGSFKDQKQSILLSRTLKAEGSSQSGNVDAKGSAIPPAVSDMDMEGNYHHMWRNDFHPRPLARRRTWKV